MVRTTILASCLALAACGSTTHDGERDFHLEWGLMGDGGSFRFESGSGVKWSFGLSGNHLTLTLGADQLVLVNAVPFVNMRFATQDLDTPDITFALSEDLAVRWHGRGVQVGDARYEIGPTGQRVPVNVRRPE